MMTCAMVGICISAHIAEITLDGLINCWLEEKNPGESFLIIGTKALLFVFIQCKDNVCLRVYSFWVHLFITYTNDEQTVSV